MRNRRVNNEIFSFLGLFFLLSCGSIIVPESNFLKDSKVTPSTLEYLWDSIRFEVEGNIPVESIMRPRNPIFRLKMRSPESSLNLGVIELQKEFDAYHFKKSFIIPYSSWMDASFLELQFNQGERNPPEPEERKVLTKGVVTTPLLAKIGKVNPNEPIPDVGLYIPTGTAAMDLSR